MKMIAIDADEAAWMNIIRNNWICPKIISEDMLHSRKVLLSSLLTPTGVNIVWMSELAAINTTNERIAMVSKSKTQAYHSSLQWILAKTNKKKNPLSLVHLFTRSTHMCLCYANT